MRRGEKRHARECLPLRPRCAASGIGPRADGRWYARPHVGSGARERRCHGRRDRGRRRRRGAVRGGRPAAAGRGADDARQRGARTGGDARGAARGGSRPRRSPARCRAPALVHRRRRRSPGTCPEKTNVVADWSPAGEGGRSLVLNGHVDVVGPASEGLWRTAPFSPRREGEWLYGRGSGDMKAGLAAIVGAVKALRGLGLAPLAPVQLQSVVEEECTGNGALQCVLTQPKPDAAVVAEPFPGSITHRAGRRALVPRRHRRYPGARGGCGGGDQRDRGGLAARRWRCASSRPSSTPTRRRRSTAWSTRSTSTWV